MVYFYQTQNNIKSQCIQEINQYCLTYQRWKWRLKSLYHKTIKIAVKNLYKNYAFYYFCLICLLRQISSPISSFFAFPIQRFMSKSIWILFVNPFFVQSILLSDQPLINFSLHLKLILWQVKSKGWVGEGKTHFMKFLGGSPGPLIYLGLGYFCCFIGLNCNFFLQNWPIAFKGWLNAWGALKLQLVKLIFHGPVTIVVFESSIKILTRL